MDMARNVRAFIFDLDGVLVDTARFHFMAWSRLAESLGFALEPEVEERLKGVSRMESLEILLEVGRVEVDEGRKSELADIKNGWYREYLSSMDESDLLPGAREFLEACRRRGLATALASSSRNADFVIRRTGVERLFDAVVSGGEVARAKPAPDLFLEAARRLGRPPSAAVVLEDAAAGIAAARAAGMASIGVGSAAILGPGGAGADLVVPGLSAISPEKALERLGSR